MKFSRISLSLFTLVAISGCAYVIPPEQNAPRNNTVIGAPHRPQLNGNVVGKGSQSALTPPANMPVRGVVAQNDMPALPPVDAQVEAEAQAQIAQNDIPATPVPVAPAAVLSDRHVPAENATFAVSANEATPSMLTVPPRPAMSGPDSTKERLKAVNDDLMQDRANADAQKAALARDAAAEPSMLAPMPTPAMGTTPAPAPVDAQPLTPLPPARIAPAVKPSVAATPTSTIASVPDFSTPAPLSAPAIAPLTLQRPVENIAATDLPAPAPAASTPITYASRPTVKPGDFDPLAAADNAPIATPSTSSTTTTRAATTYAADGYLSASRYAGRRY